MVAGPRPVPDGGCERIARRHQFSRAIEDDRCRSLEGISMRDEIGHVHLRQDSIVGHSGANSGLGEYDPPCLRRQAQSFRQMAAPGRCRRCTMAMHNSPLGTGKLLISSRACARLEILLSTNHLPRIALRARDSTAFRCRSFPRTLEPCHFNRYSLGRQRGGEVPLPWRRPAPPPTGQARACHRGPPGRGQEGSGCTAAISAGGALATLDLSRWQACPNRSTPSVSDRNRRSPGMIAACP